MISFITTILLIIVIFFLSSKTKNLLYLFCFRLTKSNPISLSFLSLLIYPGVVVHELSHLIMAVILFVPVKNITLVPEKTEEGIRSGSVTTGQTDVFRRTLIGIAPLFVGILSLWAITTYLLPPLPFVCNNETMKQWNNESFCDNSSLSPYLPSYLSIFISLYLISSISSSMYSSKKDLEALKIMVPVLLVIIGILYVLGFQIEWIIWLLNQLEGIFQTLSFILAIPVLIQVGLVLVLNMLKRILL